MDPAAGGPHRTRFRILSLRVRGWTACAAEHACRRAHKRALRSHVPAAPRARWVVVGRHRPLHAALRTMRGWRSNIRVHRSSSTYVLPPYASGARPSTVRLSLARPAPCWRGWGRPRPAGSHFFCWHANPHKSVQIWDLWSRLIESGAAFLPGSSTAAGEWRDGASEPPMCKAAALTPCPSPHAPPFLRRSAAGCFPLCFIKGQSAYMLAVGADREAVLKLRALADLVRARGSPGMLVLPSLGTQLDAAGAWLGAPEPCETVSPWMFC